MFNILNAKLGTYINDCKPSKKLRLMLMTTLFV